LGQGAQLGVLEYQVLLPWAAASAGVHLEGECEDVFITHSTATQSLAAAHLVLDSLVLPLLAAPMLHHTLLPLGQAAEAAAAEAGDKAAALQRQLAAAQSSLTQEQAAKAALEGRVAAANTSLSEAEAAGQALKVKLKQQDEEATKVGTDAVEIGKGDLHVARRVSRELR
jgi:hypothetical protein